VSQVEVLTQDALPYALHCIAVLRGTAYDLM